MYSVRLLQTPSRPLRAQEWHATLATSNDKRASPQILERRICVLRAPMPRNVSKAERWRSSRSMQAVQALEEEALARRAREEGVCQLS